MSCSGKILTAPGVDLDLVADVAEKRYADLRAGLHDRGLGSACGGIALEAGFGLGNLKLHEHRRFNRKRDVIIGIDLDHIVLFDELHVVTNNILAERNLVKCLCIHERIELAILIQILIFLAVDPGLREFLCRPEGCLSHTAIDNIFQLGSDERCAFTRFNMLELNDLENASIFLNRNAIPEITCRII